MPRRRVVNDDLKKRGQVWWLRKRVPKDVVEDYGKAWVEESLRTADVVEARRRRDVRLSMLEEHWEALRRHGNTETLQGLAEAHAWEKRFADPDRPSVADRIWDEVDVKAERWGRQNGLFDLSGGPNDLARVRERFVLETKEGRALDRKMAAALGELSFVAAGERWLAHSGLNVRTQREYRRYIAMANEAFSSVERVDPKEAREWVQEQAKGYTKKSIENLQNALSGLWRHLGKSPAVWRDFRVDAGVARLERQVWSRDEIQTLFEAAANLPSKTLSRKLRLAMIIALYTGARAREVTGLELLADERLILIPKEAVKGQKRERMLPYVDALQPVLEEWVADRWATNTLTNRFGSFKKGLGFTSRDKVFHSFRHTLLSQLHTDGVQEATAALIAGHKHKGITYGIYGDKLQAKALLPHLEALPWLALYGRYL
tara:strand:+ start:172 stop:1464 length:1293 start_codon:yes stop_codon:yes gene_type:complete